MASENESPQRLEHGALVYRGPDHFLKVVAPFVRDGLDRRQRTFVAARGDYLDALTSEVGEGSAAVEWADTEEWHPHPARRLRALHDFVTKGLRAGAAAIRLVGEPVWPEAPELAREWQRYESVLNAILAPFPVTLLCLYDGARLDRSIVASARCTHPWIVGDGDGADFEEPERLLRRWSWSLTPPPPGSERVVRPIDLSAARDLVRDRAIAAGVDPAAAADAAVALSEILTNALLHGDGTHSLAVWVEDGRFVCQVEDAGAGLLDPLAGYRPPRTAESGYGLWIARQLVELIQIDAGPTGTRVRFHVPISPVV